MASKGSILRGVVERLSNLRRIVPDNAGRVRVAVETSANTQAVSGTVAVSTVTTVTTVTNWGAVTGQAYSQQMSNATYSAGQRRSLVVS